VNADSARLAQRRAALEGRAAIVRAIRRWFDAEGFLEVDTPARVPSPGQEVHLQAIATGARWLITSPEYHMKRLLAGGMPRIVQICKAWRDEEVGPHHQGEFTVAEWYRANQPLERIADDCEALVRTAVSAVGGDAGMLNVAQPFARTTVSELFQLHLGVRLFGDETAATLAAKIGQAGVDVGSARAYDDIFFQAFLDRIEPHLGRKQPTFVFDWPAPLGALARRKPSHAGFVERFELYGGGLELANAFGELTDPVEQRARFVEESAARAARGRPVYPIDEKLLAALADMPPTAGVALGVDRLVMFALGISDICDVVAFADDEV
jgi:lysyl-tRNA synthetase class 2